MQRSIVEVRVVYCDVDRMNVVHHGSYFRYFEQARTEFMRRRGIPYADVEARGLILPIVALSVRYASPARYDDLLAIDTTISNVRRVSVTFTYEVRRVGEDGRTLVRAETVLACCEANGRPVPLPPDLLAALERDEVAPGA
jgi:acyl-CoA thioester hydrolase